MDAEYGRAAFESQGVEHGGGVESLVGGDAEQACGHRLARDANEQRTFKRPELAEVSEEVVILVKVLAESESRVGYYVGYACRAGCVDAACCFSEALGGCFGLVPGKVHQGRRRPAHDSAYSVDILSCTRGQHIAIKSAVRSV